MGDIQLFRRDLVICKQNGASNGGAKLAHVSGPRIGQQRIDGRFGEASSNNKLNKYCQFKQMSELLEKQQVTMINNLTTGMIQLSEEISALRHNRAIFRNRLALGRANLEKKVSALVAGFRRDRMEMSEKSRAEVAEFMRDFITARAAWYGSAARANSARTVSAEPKK